MSAFAAHSWTSPRRTPDRCVVVDASQPEAMVAEDVWETVLQRSIREPRPMRVFEGGQASEMSAATGNRPAGTCGAGPAELILLAA